MVYSELSLRRTPSGPSPAVRLMEVSALKRVLLEKNKLNSARQAKPTMSTLERCPPYSGVCFERIDCSTNQMWDVKR